jgi:hypothetical protein
LGRVMHLADSDIDAGNNATQLVIDVYDKNDF